MDFKLSFEYLVNIINKLFKNILAWQHNIT